MAVVEKVRAVEMTALPRGFTHFKFSVIFVFRIVLIIYIEIKPLLINFKSGW